MTRLAALLRIADLADAIHARFPELIIVAPRVRTCRHGQATGDCDRCAKDRLRKRRALETRS